VAGIDEAAEHFIAARCHVLIWDAVSSKTEQSKGLEFLDRLTKNSARTYMGKSHRSQSSESLRAPNGDSSCAGR
jgi:hypothetical protein